MGINELKSKINSDKEFARKYSGLLDFTPFVDQAKRDGYNITGKDVIGMMGSGSGELSDADLGNVAGGICFISIVPDFSIVKVGEVCIA